MIAKKPLWGAPREDVAGGRGDLWLDGFQTEIASDQSRQLSILLYFWQLPDKFCPFLANFDNFDVLLAVVSVYRSTLTYIV